MRVTKFNGPENTVRVSQKTAPRSRWRCNSPLLVIIAAWDEK